MNKEKLINEIMKECADDGEPVTREEAEEMAEMEIKSKKDCKRYERKEKHNKPSNRQPKIDAEKVKIIHYLACCLEDFTTEEESDTEVCFWASNILKKNPQKEITFSVGENEYSITLTKHRKKEKEN